MLELKYIFVLDYDIKWVAKRTVAKNLVEINATTLTNRGLRYCFDEYNDHDWFVL